MFLVKTQNAIEYFSDNYGHILAIFDMLTFFFSSRVKWKIIIIVLNMVSTSCLFSYKTTQDLRAYKIRKYKKNLKSTWNSSLVPRLPPKIKIFSKRVKKIIEKQIMSFYHSALFYMSSMCRIMTILYFDCRKF